MRKYLDNRDLVPDMALAPSSGVVSGKMQSLPEPKISLYLIELDREDAAAWSLCSVPGAG